MILGTKKWSLETFLNLGSIVTPSLAHLHRIYTLIYTLLQPPKRSAHATEEKDLRKELLEAATSSAVSDGQPTTQQPSTDRKYQVQCVLCKKTGWRKKPKKGGQWQCTCKGYGKMLHTCGSTAGMCKC